MNIDPRMASMLSPYPASFFPSLDAARHGAEQARYGKEPFKLTDYQVRVFNMCRDSDREEYCRLMERLMPLILDVKCVVSKNELQVLSTPEGQGWYRYVEWYEYKLNDVSLTTRREDAEKDSGEDDDGDDGDDGDSNDSSDFGSDGTDTDGFL